jgi:hypothetical protein
VKDDKKIDRNIDQVSEGVEQKLLFIVQRRVYCSLMLDEEVVCLVSFFFFWKNVSQTKLSFVEWDELKRNCADRDVLILE